MFTGEKPERIRKQSREMAVGRSTFSFSHRFRPRTTNIAGYANVDTSASMKNFVYHDLASRKLVLGVKHTTGNSTRTSEGRPQIFVVLVVYQTVVSDCISLVSFSRALEESGLTSRFRLLIYDNSPSQALFPEGLAIRFSCVHDPNNGGLFRAYSTALQWAEKEQYSWLLLLDQDTVVDATFLKMLCSNLPEADSNPRCAALVPKLQMNEKIISPTRVLWGWRLLPVDKGFFGSPPWELTSFNSGTLLRLSAIHQIGGFNPTFWLDYLDHWLFNQLYHTGFSVQVLNTALAHELSVQNMGAMRVDRYNNMLLAESEFYRCCKAQSENIAYLGRLLFRAFKLLLITGKRRLFFATIRHLEKNIRRALGS